MRTIETTVYEFDELSDQAKERAREWYREASADDREWHEQVSEDATNLFSLIGFTIKEIRFSGFGSQGDGASLTGTYRYQRGGVNALMDHAPNEHELHRIARALKDLQQRNGYQLTATIRPDHRCHYVHERSTDIDVEHGWETAITDETVTALTALIIDINRWIYRQLEDAYEWEYADEQVDESIIANEYTFTADGKRCG